MRTAFLAILLSFASALFASDTPRVVALSGLAHPKAEIVSVDYAHGVLIYNWIKADNTRADSGNSVARFTPPEPLPKDKPTDPDTYAELTDEQVAAAIAASQ